MPKRNVDATGLGLKGFDPVSYFEKDGPVEGLLEYTSEHNGVTYRFASPSHV